MNTELNFTTILGVYFFIVKMKLKWKKSGSFNEIYTIYTVELSMITKVESVT